MQTLKRQLSLTIVFLVFVTVSLISFVSNTMIRHKFESYVTKRQEEKSRSIVETMEMLYNRETADWNRDSIHTLGMNVLQEGYIIKVSDAEGQIVWDAENHDMSYCHEVMSQIERRMKSYGTPGEFVTKNYSLTQGGQPVGGMDIIYFGPFFLNESDFSFLNSLNLIIVLIGLAALAVAFVIGGVLARRIAAPVAETAKAARDIAAGHYDVKARDNTKTRELHNLVGAINQLAAALSEQENLRKCLCADVAHELRTPLTTLGTHLEAMIEGIWEATPERLRSCHEEIERLGKLVSDVENLQRVESDNLKLRKKPVELLTLAKSVGQSFEGILAQKGLKLMISGEETTADADPDRIRSVLVNLISNAVKYTEAGGEITIRTADQAEKSRIVVEDTGPGITQAELPRIFERFYRADRSRNRETGGSGIGLAIVKAVVTAHGGSVRAENVTPHGARFIVEIGKS